jgi:hypothetical protein
MDGTDRPDGRKERVSQRAACRYNGWVRRAASATGLFAVAALALGLSACGGGSTTTTTEASTTGSSTTSPATSHHGHGANGAYPDRTKPSDRKPSGRGQSTHQAVKAAVSENKPARLNPAERRAAAVVREYVDALDSRNGQRACALFLPGALSKVRFPRDRGDCPRSLGSSIGYRDPRGFPVYEGSRVARINSVALDGTDARVVATTVTDFAGNREPSIEDDVVYLRQEDGRWLIAKPSAALYRAIGVGDIPPSVLAPPK